MRNVLESGQVQPRRRFRNTEPPGEAHWLRRGLAIAHREEYLDSCGIFRNAVLAMLAVIAKQERVRRV